MYKLFLDTLEDAGIVLPTWFFVIVLVIIAIYVICIMLKKYIKPMILYIEDINKKLGKTDEIDQLRTGQESEIKRSTEKDDELKQEIKTLSDVVYETQKKIDVFAENRVKDRAQSFQIQKELIDAQTRISDSVNDIAKKIDQMKIDTDERFKKSQEKQDARVRAELKDKIGNLYRIYHNRGKITQMEFEAFEGLIDTYISYNGNSFVKEIVIPELYTWQIVDNDYYENN